VLPWLPCLQSFFRFWDVASFCINGMVFFFVGASVTNFLLR
jgi:NhaP-type Na+/H+ or K+/H+ antiporter